MVLHEFHFLVLDAGALGKCSCLLHAAGVLAQFLVCALHHTSSTFGIARQEAVNHKVGIAAYGRGEMCIIVEAQPVVTDILRAVFRLHHGS